MNNKINISEVLLNMKVIDEEVRSNHAKKELNSNDKFKENLIKEIKQIEDKYGIVLNLLIDAHKASNTKELLDIFDRFQRSEENIERCSALLNNIEELMCFAIPKIIIAIYQRKINGLKHNLLSLAEYAEFEDLYQIVEHFMIDEFTKLHRLDDGDEE